MSASEPTLRDLIEPIIRDVLASMKSDVVLVSQLNVEAVLGISPRMHLDFCRRPDFTPRVIHAGKMRLVDVGEYRTWLRSIARAQKLLAIAESEVDDASAVLAELGLRERPRLLQKKKPSGPRDSGSSDL